MDPVTMLLLALGSGTAQGLGQELWQQLRTIWRRPHGRRNVQDDRVTSALDSLAETPGDRVAAEDLLEAIQDRARVDPQFREGVTAWAEEALRALGLPASSSRQGSLHLYFGVVHQHIHR